MQVDSLKLNIFVYALHFARFIDHHITKLVCNNIMRESFPQYDYIEKQFTKIRPTEMFNLNDLHRKINRNAKKWPRC